MKSWTGVDARPDAAQQRLQALVRLAPTGRIPDLRTKLDEWAAFRVGGGLLTSGGKQRWFNYPCPVREAARLKRYMDWVSPAARVILDRGESGDRSVSKPPRGTPDPNRLVVDHTIPIRVLREAISSDRSLWQVPEIESFLLRYFIRSVITKSEDRQLEAKVPGGGRSLRQRMPTGALFADEPFARYRAAGIRAA
jgi:hypothetical protein